MLDLPTVTLLCVETQMHEMARITLADCMSKANFGEVVIHTDKPDLIPIPGARYIEVQNWPEKILCGRYCYNESPQSVKTEHMIFIEWDGGIRNVEAWEPSFLDYDYIGAPWPGRIAGQWEPGVNRSVGNGGFTLWSRKMMDFVHLNPAWLIGTDTHISINYRPALERMGAKWAPEEVAYRFSFEHGIDTQRAKPSFGYHDIFNWPLALDRAELERRTRLLLDSDYVKKGTPKLYALGQRAPWLRTAIENFDEAMNLHRHVQRAHATGPRLTMQQRLIQEQKHAELQRKGIKA